MVSIDLPKLQQEARREGEIYESMRHFLGSVLLLLLLLLLLILLLLLLLLLLRLLAP